MDSNDRQTLDLEDIMNEFHQDPDCEDLELDVELPQDFKDFINPEAEDTIVLPTGKILLQEQQEEAEAAAVTSDTIRLDDLQIDPESISRPEQAETIPVEEAKAEAYTQSWEPEYEQPMGEYIPPQPIVFMPRSRLRELKRKLVAGPEKRYYALTEKGVGKLQAAIFLSILVALLCVGATAMYAMGMVQPNRLRLMVFVQFFGMLLSALLGSYQMIEGVTDLFRKGMTANTLLVVTFLICCVDGVFCLQRERIPCCGAFSLQVTMSLWGAYQARLTEMGQMDTMRKAIRLDSLSACPDYHEGKKGFLRGEGQVEDFMDHYNQVSAPERVLSWYYLFALLAAAGIGVTAGMFYDVHTGIQVAAVSILAAVPASMFVTLTRPASILQRRLHKLGAVICGWQGVAGLCGKALFPLTHQDVYPAGSVRMNGVKFFGSRATDDVVAYCAAMVCADDSGLAPVFTQVLDSRNGIHYTPDFVEYHDGGISGSINGEAVLVGTLSFMKEMEIAIPEGTKVSNAVCIAIDGAFSGLFALTYEKVKGSSAGIGTLCAYRGLQPVITGTDFVLCESFIRNKFGVKTKRFLFPEPQVRQQLQEKALPEETGALLLVTGQGLAPFAYGVTGARALRQACRAGIAVHMAGGLLGLAMMLVLVLLGGLDMVTPVNVLAYQLVWMVPGLLITEWTRAI